MSIELGLLELLGALELFVVLLVVAIVMAMRAHGWKRKYQEQDFPEPESHVIHASEGVEYDAYLRDEIIKTQGFIDAYGKSEDDAPAWLKARHQFLKLELEAQDLVGDPSGFQAKLSTGFDELIDAHRPPPEVITEQVEVAAEPEPEPEPEPEQPADAQQANAEHEKEKARLRDLIGHQQFAMQKLRAELETREGDIADIDSIMAQLDSFERQTAELVRCIEVLEQENDRLKEAGAEGDGDPGVNPAELEQLRDMVESQQSTISQLQSMIETMPEETGDAGDLEDMVNDVLQSNQELNTCILVLEEENQELRAKLEASPAEPAPDEDGGSGGDASELKQKLQEVESLLEFKEATIEQLEHDLDAARASAGDSGGDEALRKKMEELQGLLDFKDATVEQLEKDLETARAGNGGGDTEELEIKIQELEAQVEFKEAAVEELEKQYAELERKYLELTGDEATG